MRKYYPVVLLVALLFAGSSYGQADSLMDMLNKSDGSSKAGKKDAVSATFKATRIINSSTVENLAAGVLDFRISHRFGQLNQGAQNFFGLDNATTRLGLDYGITKWLMVGIGHSTLNKENDGSMKIKLLGQKKSGMPITLSYAGAISVTGPPVPTVPPGDKWYFSNRLYFTNQLLIARKISDRISLQLMPTIVHFNLVDSTKNPNDILALGIGGRIKVSKRIAVTGEYYYRLTNTDMLNSGATTYNSFSVGCDIETGGHVFQLFFTNSPGLTERTFIAQTTDSWQKGALHFGFNISRVFTIVKPKEFRNGGKGW